VAKFSDLVALAFTMMANNTCAPVQLTREAEALLDAFDAECDDYINARNNNSEAQRALWNRAHLKSLRIAGVLAASNNPHAPTVDEGMARWSIAFVRRGVSLLVRRFNEGGVGSGDTARLAAVNHQIKAYFAIDGKELAKYGSSKTLRDAGVIPYRWFAVRLAGTGLFNKSVQGASRAVSNALDEAVQTETLVELSQLEAQQKFGKRARCYLLGPACSAP
jgi:hypothetical protein